MPHIPNASARRSTLTATCGSILICDPLSLVKAPIDKVLDAFSFANMTRQIIIDVDAGSDDAVAILLLLALEPDSDFKVLGITCTHGNAKVDDVCANVLRTLETIDRQDVRFSFTVIVTPGCT